MEEPDTRATRGLTPPHQVPRSAKLLFLSSGFEEPVADFLEAPGVVGESAFEP